MTNQARAGAPAPWRGAHFGDPSQDQISCMLVPIYSPGEGGGALG